MAWLFARTLIISFGFMLRIEAALLFLPFITLEVLSGFASAKKLPVFQLFLLQTSVKVQRQYNTFSPGHSFPKHPV